MADPLVSAHAAGCSAHTQQHWHAAAAQPLLLGILQQCLQLKWHIVVQNPGSEKLVAAATRGTSRCRSSSAITTWRVSADAARQAQGLVPRHRSLHSAHDVHISNPIVPPDQRTTRWSASTMHEPPPPPAAASTPSAWSPPPRAALFVMLIHRTTGCVV